MRRLRPGEGLQAFIGVLVLLALLPVLFRMEPSKFAPFAEAYNWIFIGRGLLTTVGVAAIAIVLSLPLAVLFALGRLAARPGLRWPSVAFIEGVRALPVLLFIYFTGWGLRRSGAHVGEWSPMGLDLSGIDLEAAVPVVIALTLYTTVVNAETIRAGILALDKGQTEAAYSLGLGYWGALRLVILPQAFRNVLPPLIAQFATLVKDTSLGYIVGLLELSRRAQILYNGNRNPLETIYIVAVIYFVLNFLLGQLAQRVEQRLQVSRRAAPAP